MEYNMANKDVGAIRGAAEDGRGKRWFRPTANSVTSGLSFARSGTSRRGQITREMREAVLAAADELGHIPLKDWKK